MQIRKEEMNRFKKITLVLVIIIAIAFIFPTSTFAQIDPGCDPSDPACPIDGGISILIAAGIGLGAKRAMAKKK